MDLSPKKVVILFVTLIVCEIFTSGSSNELTVVESDSEETDSDTRFEDDMEHENFVPTKEWQEIKPGQAIPSGLHVKIDLQSGKKEAKLIDEVSHNSEGAEVNLEESDSPHQHGKVFSPDELKEALKLIKNEEPLDKKDAIKRRFRSMDELKKEFATLNMNIKTEAEILVELFEKYKKGYDKITALHDLEFLLHQYDLAQDFVKMGGINMLLPDFNSTESRIRSLVAFTLGSAMQGNPPVQISVLESNVMQPLLHLVSHDESSEVQARSLYALSCLLRNFPAAQKSFFHSGGITVLADLFRPHKMAPFKLQMKVVTLLHDLLSEKHLTEQHVQGNDNVQQEKLRQYKSFQLEATLKENGFCSFLPKLLSVPDHDTQEKVVSAMQSLVLTCSEAFFGSLDSLRSLAEQYKVAALEEEEENKSDSSSDGREDLYFLTLYSLITDLISSVEQRYKDEL